MGPWAPRGPWTPQWPYHGPHGPQIQALGPLCRLPYRGNPFSESQFLTPRDGGGGAYDGKGIGYTSVSPPSGPNQVPNSGTLTGYSDLDALSGVLAII